MSLLEVTYNDDLAQPSDEFTSKDTAFRWNGSSFICLPQVMGLQKMIVHPHEQFVVQDSGTHRELNSFWVPENVNAEMKSWLQVYCFHLYVFPSELSQILSFCFSQ